MNEFYYFEQQRVRNNASCPRGSLDPDRNVRGTHPFVAPTRALGGPPYGCAGTDHAEEGVEHRQDCPSVADIARRDLRTRGGLRQLRKFLVGRGAGACEWGN